MPLGDQLGILILSLTMGAQVFLRSLLVRHRRKILWLSVVLVFGIASYWTSLQYQAFAAHPVSRLLLPPYQSIAYFYAYAGERFFAPWLLALLAALLVSAAAEYLNRRFGGRFFEQEELSFMQLGMFLNGYPGFLFHLLLVLFFGALLSGYYVLSGRGRAPLYYLWLPTAILAILLKAFLIPKEFLSQFNL